VDGYVIGDRLGTGAHGEVRRAQVAGRPGRVVAIKRFPGAARDAQLAQVRREAEALRRLSHPSIVRLLDVVADGDDVALVAPYLSGGTLAARIVHGPLPPAAVVDLGARLGDALGAAHTAGVVHGDVTPTNVLYDAEDQPLLADFGAAVLAGDEGAEVHGTASYLDPDVALGDRGPDPASDQYALGAVLFEAAAGVPPYAAPTAEAATRAADRGVHLPLEELAPELPPAAAAAIERAIHRDPAARFPTVRELAGRLEEVRATLPTWVAAGPRGAEAGAEVGSGASCEPRPPPPWAALDAGTSLADATRRYGPRRPAPGPAPVAVSDRRRRWPWVVGAAWLVALGLGVAGAATVLGDREDGEVAAASSTAGPSSADPQTEVRDDEAVERGAVDRGAVDRGAVERGAVERGAVDRDEDRPPEGGDEAGGATDALRSATSPPCDDAVPPAGRGERVAADLDGRGCTIDLGWDPDDRVLTIPADEGGSVRYQLGEPGDELLVGDWTCDGRETPALYRPTTGEVFAFDGFAGPGGELDSGPATDTGVRDGDPVVRRDDDGCATVEVEPSG
jgi:eukaryotic-like serine/threonine-protein kinase